MPHALNPADPPVAPSRDSVRHDPHGYDVVDEYAWMSDHNDADLLAYLAAERAYYDSACGHLADLSRELSQEMSRRLPPTEESVRYRRGDFFYYTRTVAGSEYEQFMSSRDPSGTGRVVLDESELGQTSDNASPFVAIGVCEVSPDSTILAYSVDLTGDEVYALRFRNLRPDRDLTVDDDLTANEDLAADDDLMTKVTDDPAPGQRGTAATPVLESVARTYYGGAWSADSGSFFYTVHDAAYRPYQVWRHHIGPPANADTLVYTESDARFEVTVRASTDQAYIIIDSASRDTTETWIVPAHTPDTPPKRLFRRRTGIESHVDHGGGCWYAVTNDGAAEFQLVSAPDGPGAPQWTQLAAAQEGERLHRVHALAHHLLVELRRDGYPALRIVDTHSGAESTLCADQPPGKGGTGFGVEAGRIELCPRFGYHERTVTVKVESLVQPPRWYTVDLIRGKHTLVRTREIHGYEAGRYRTARVFAPAPDGVAVPVTLAWHAGTPHDGTAPCLMWGYGAYESCDDPFFDEGLPSALDRGVIYALVHPRGGGELGREWWLDGRLATKPNTFSDYLAAADWLDRSGIVDGSRIATRGLSAGGLLQAVVFGRRPDRWRAVVAEVPFVDVIATMLDASIPLTVNEWDEWGNPRNADEYAVMRGYSPYDNIPTGVRRPTLLVTAALHDPRVMVHEPAKWVARLRRTASPDDGILLLRTELGAGAHTGPAGRYAHAAYEAEIYAFILSALDLTHASPASQASPLPTLR